MTDANKFEPLANLMQISNSNVRRRQYFGAKSVKGRRVYEWNFY